MFDGVSVCVYVVIGVSQKKKKVALSSIQRKGSHQATYSGTKLFPEETYGSIRRAGSSKVSLNTRSNTFSFLCIHVYF